jgi:hypothetical protein
MQMEVVNGLSAMLAGVDDDAIPARQVLSSCELGRSRHEMTEQLAVVGIGLTHGADVLAWNDEQMHGRLGMNIGEGVAKFILINGMGRNGSVNDLAKEAAHIGISLQQCLDATADQIGNRADLL